MTPDHLQSFLEVLITMDIKQFFNYKAKDTFKGVLKNKQTNKTCGNIPNVHQWMNR